jgi:Uma2 family endonuclease
MSTQVILDSPVAPPLPLRRFSVQEYHQLAEVGILTPEDRVELLEGWIIEKMNQRPIHGFVVRLLSELFSRGLPSGWLCQCQLPITTERSEPEPDLAIVRGKHSDFRSRHPNGLQCRLVIEVADTSLDRDRSKSSIYRDAGVEEYWIVNVQDKQLERYEFRKEQAEPTILDSTMVATILIDTAELRIDLTELFA